MNNLSAYLFTSNFIVVKYSHLYVGVLNLKYSEEGAAGC